MLMPLAIALSQVGGAPLKSFVDDGNTKTHTAPPTLLPLTVTGGRLSTVLRIGTKPVRLWVVAKGSSRSLFCDQNGNGRLDPGEGRTMESMAHRLPDGTPITIYQSPLVLKLGARNSAKYGVNLFVSKSNDPGFLRVRNRLALYALSGFVGTAKIGPKSYRIGVRGTDLANGSLFIDRDGDGLLGTVPAEMFALGKPFNLDGRSYRVSTFQPDQFRIAFSSSATWVAEIPMPADLRVGRVVPPVLGKTLAGKTLTFPKSFPGKLVLLDVWATWCGPCKGEIPYMKSAYAKYRSRGFEICSMSIDDPGMGPQVAAFTRANGMAWTQVFQGQGWASPVCRRYDIRGIPFMLLVDGSTGRILAREDQLRGPGILEGTVAAALSRRL